MWVWVDKDFPLKPKENNLSENEIICYGKNVSEIYANMRKLLVKIVMNDLLKYCFLK